MKNDCQICKIKVRKFLFNILRRFGVMEENPKGGGADSARGTVGLTLAVRGVRMTPTVF